ncbi:carboxypeptidase-like regulatory domain-containing protein [Eudoraea chungangensis]|uniref:carboxypeptidase-like regulatory domain-containing protein n=1 Tax=Eudoraea chungangensis TaxID=1481905 RepID=UPI0023EDA5F0|nr:carboxypeptidase-like regulatory domain-containing protein [Eudoraea chungangensis]
MKNLVLVLTLLLSGFMFSQERASVRGTILDNETNNEPMLFANVHLKNTSINAKTNFHGNFEIDNLDPGEYILIVSYLGYETVEIPIAVKTNETIQVLKELQAIQLSNKDIADLTKESEESTSLTAYGGKHSGS